VREGEGRKRERKKERPREREREEWGREKVGEEGGEEEKRTRKSKCAHEWAGRQIKIDRNRDFQEGTKPDACSLRSSNGGGEQKKGINPILLAILQPNMPTKKVKVSAS